jgi:hypothetical protein
MGVPLYAVCLTIQTQDVILYLLGHFSPSNDMMLITAKIWTVYFLCTDTVSWGA